MIKRVIGAALLAVLAAGSLTLAACGRSDDGEPGGVWPGAKVPLGSGGNLWVVPAGAKNKQLAYDFIDITLQKKIQNILGNAGGVPVAADSSAITEPRARKLIDGFTTLARSSGLAYYHSGLPR
ncbi:hypothetical protein WMF00_51370 [Sorangium sp. So ce1182]